jgi:hypothetical protein
MLAVAALMRRGASIFGTVYEVWRLKPRRKRGIRGKGRAWKSGDFLP